MIYFNIGGGRGGGHGGGNSGSYGVNDCSGGGVKGWEDPFNGHHEEKGGSNVKSFLNWKKEPILARGQAVCLSNKQINLNKEKKAFNRIHKIISKFYI